MKKAIFVLILGLILGCSQERIKRPNPFMSEDQMTQFLVDLALVSSATSYAKNNYVPIDSIYAFHGIDSLIFTENNLYYASKPKQYIRIFEAAEKQLQQLDTLYLFEKNDIPLLKK